jgi:hypothetical protein
MPKPKHIAATALSAGAEFAVGEALKTVLAPIVAVITPPLPPDVRHAQQQKYLLNPYTGLLEQGESLVEADAIVQQEACVLHVAGQLVSGELGAGAVSKLE